MSSCSHLCSLSSGLGELVEADDTLVRQLCMGYLKAYRIVGDMVAFEGREIYYLDAAHTFQIHATPLFR